MADYGVWVTRRLYAAPGMPPTAMTSEGADLDDLMAYVNGPAFKRIGRFRPLIAQYDEAAGKWRAIGLVWRDGTLRPLSESRSGSKDGGAAYDICRELGKRWSTDDDHTNGDLQPWYRTETVMVAARQQVGKP